MYHRGLCRVGVVAVLLVLQACKGHSVTLPSGFLCIDFCSSSKPNPQPNLDAFLVIGVPASMAEPWPPAYRTIYPVGTRVSLYLVRITFGGNPLLKADTITTATWTSSNDAVARFATPSVPGRGDLDGLAAGEVQVQAINGAPGIGAPSYSAVFACGLNAFPQGDFGGSCAPLNGIRFVP
jgi:hypothetical protein